MQATCLSGLDAQEVQAPGTPGRSGQRGDPVQGHAFGRDGRLNHTGGRYPEDCGTAGHHRSPSPQVSHQVAVKLGAPGALYAAAAQRYLATPPPVSPVDATGAGDCFNAGLLAGLLRGGDPPAALALGCAAGAASTPGVGGTGSCPGLSAALALARDVTVRAWP
jgi:pfkB family carbohydrate kinase